MSDSDSPHSYIQIYNPENLILPDWHPHRPVRQHSIPHVYDDATLLHRFTTQHQRNNWSTYFHDIAIVGERRIEWDSLPTRMRGLLQRFSLEHLAKSPSPTSIMNRSIVREFYTLVRSKIDGADDTIPTSGVYKLRGVDVFFTSDWINRYYHIPEISDIQVLESQNHFQYPTYPEEWLRVFFEWIGSSICGTVQRDHPSNAFKSFSYAFLKRRVDFGSDIVRRIGDISLNRLGDGYLYYPFLITTLTRECHVPEYDNDDIGEENSPIIFCDFPWFV